jgi:hypothetical protein
MDEESMDQFDSTCKIGKYVGTLSYHDDTTAHCEISNVENGFEAEVALPVAVSFNSFDYVDTGFTYSTYGILNIAPKGGPIGGGTEVLVKGFGFAV